MNFLVPFYLLGALAVAVPIYLHLRRKPPKDSVEFSSLMFLNSTDYPPVKRSRLLENLPLLLLRCLALLLLAALFARPFFSGGEESIEKGQVRTVLLLDTSASMRRDGLWEMAQAEVAKVLAEAESGDEVAILTVDGSARTLVNFDDWREAAESRREDLAMGAIESLEPSWQGTDLGLGLLAAADLLADAVADEEMTLEGRIVVVSDLQEGANLEAVAGATWQDGLKVELRPVEADASTNATLAVAPSQDPARPMVRVSNDEVSESGSFTLKVDDDEISALVPPGESRVFELPAGTEEVVLAGDAQDFDNRLFLAPREAAVVTLGFLGDGKADDADGPEYYFRRAFGRSELLDPRFIEGTDEVASILTVARPLAAAEAEKVHAALEQGGRVLLLLSSTSMAETLARLAGVKDGPSLEESSGRYAMLEGIDFDHPLLSGFSDPRWRDFTEVHFWHHRKLDPAALPGTQVIARFDNGDPAWLEMPVGSGSLVVMSSGWHPGDSQLALSSKFVPLLYSIFAEQGPRVGEVGQFFVGDSLPVEASDRRLILPDGGIHELVDGAEFRANEPGVYRVEGGSRGRRYAVNLRQSESLFRPLSRESLIALGVPLAGGGVEKVPAEESDKRRLRNREAEEDQHLWRWAAMGLLVLLVVESAVASRGSYARSLREGVPS
ncbi:BatA domain-containing protein [Haloferula chungangensis]|uniref:BatA domain-containing protein n=1 Tax=Haloferula chungangensis TaxID=1048331 RepID=A0ABW2L5Y2_9BACT